MFGGYCGIRFSLRCENTTKIGMPSPSPGPGRDRPNGPAGPVRSTEQFETPDLPHIVQAAALQRDTLPRSNTALRSTADLCARQHPPPRLQRLQAADAVGVNVLGVNLLGPAVQDDGPAHTDTQS